jgi:hypothetical protein
MILHKIFFDDSDDIAEADEQWLDKRGKDKVTVHHSTGPDPELIRVVAPDINEHSFSFHFFRLIFTEELFCTILTNTNHYCQQHTQKTIVISRTTILKSKLYTT